VVDYAGDTIRDVDGALGSDWSSGKGVGTGDVELSLTAALVTVIPVLPKELARVMAQYARPTGVRTIAGAFRASGSADGHALREAVSSIRQTLLSTSRPVLR
jgi:hypothetical protein